MPCGVGVGRRHLESRGQGRAGRPGGHQAGRAPVPVGVLASAVRGSERPWHGPGKARSLGFPGAGPSLARGGPPAQQLVWQPCCGSSHLALDLGLRPSWFLEGRFFLRLPVPFDVRP